VYSIPVREDTAVFTRTVRIGIAREIGWNESDFGRRLINVLCGTSAVSIFNNVSINENVPSNPRHCPGETLRRTDGAPYTRRIANRPLREAEPVSRTLILIRASFGRRRETFLFSDSKTFRRSDNPALYIPYGRSRDTLPPIVTRLRLRTTVRAHRTRQFPTVFFARRPGSHRRVPRRTTTVLVPSDFRVHHPYPLYLPSSIRRVSRNESTKRSARKM